MRDTEELVAELVVGVQRRTATCRARARSIAVAPPFPRLTVAEAFERFAGIEETDVLRDGARATATLSFACSSTRSSPRSSTSTTPGLSRRLPRSRTPRSRAPNRAIPRVCERFELYRRRRRALQRLRRAHRSERAAAAPRRRPTRARGGRQAVYPIDERFLAALAAGMPPSAGNALGVDRLVALCLGEREIARVMPFPAGVVVSRVARHDRPVPIDPREANAAVRVAIYSPSA